MQLTGLLDGARKRYSRLYFLSDAELARLLSVHYAPAALTPFVRRLFPTAALRELRFSLPTDPAPPAARPPRGNTNPNSQSPQRERETTRTSANSAAVSGATARSTRSSRPATTKRLEEKFNGALYDFQQQQQHSLRHSNW